MCCHEKGYNEAIRVNEAEDNIVMSFETNMILSSNNTDASNLQNWSIDKHLNIIEKSIYFGY
jgi:hypothetical protein